MSTKRVLSAIAVCLLLAPYTTGSAKAQGSEPGPCYFHLLSPENYIFNSSACSSFVLGTMEWATLSPGLVNAWLQDVDISFSVQGPGLNLDMSREETAKLWSPISAVPSVTYGIACPMKENLWQSVWMKELGKLGPGEYQVHAVFVLNHPVTDALQQCSYLDGTPVGHYLYGPFVWVNDLTVTILDQ